MRDHTTPRAPRQLPAGRQSSAPVYFLKNGYYAAHGLPPDTPTPGAAFVLDRGQIAVFPRDAAAPDTGPPKPTLGPVYAAADGPLAVPTGLLFVRFKEGTLADDRRDDLERAGFAVVKVPRSAPHAAWVRARKGGIATSLARMSVLAAMPDVENVEPQMLMESVRR